MLWSRFFLIAVELKQKICLNNEFSKADGIGRYLPIERVGMGQEDTK